MMIFDESVWWQGWRRGCGDGQGAAPADPPSLYKLPATSDLSLGLQCSHVVAHVRLVSITVAGGHCLHWSLMSRSMLSGFWS